MPYCQGTCKHHHFWVHLLFLGWDQEGFWELHMLMKLHRFTWFSCSLIITGQATTVSAKLLTVPTHVAILLCHIKDPYKNLCWPKEKILPCLLVFSAWPVWYGSVARGPGHALLAMNSSYTPIISHRPSCLVQDLYERVGKGHKEMRWPQGQVWGQGGP